MKSVKPSTWTTLLIDRETYFPFGVATAKGAFYNMLKNRGHGIDADGVPYNFEAMQKRSLAIYPDHPVMRSAPNALTGEETVWPIPTVFVINESFFRGRGKRYRADEALPSIQEVGKAARWMCAFCGEHVDLRDASREHIVSRSNGGSNSSINIAFAHKLCNSRAGNIEPKLDKSGNPIKNVTIVRATHFIFPSEKMDMRDEYKPFLGLT